jgi:hypothetical protein
MSDWRISLRHLSRAVVEAPVVHSRRGMRTVSRVPPGSTHSRRGLAEIEGLAWLLDNSIPVPGTGRRFGIDALIGFVQVVGDLVSGGIGLYVVWRGSRLGLPRVVVARMLANSLIDLAIGSIPFIGDAFDLWFKANSRNLAIIRRHLEEPETSTVADWVILSSLIGGIVAIVALLGWLVVSVISALAGMI